MPDSTDLYRYLPADAVNMALTLFLGFLMGVEREEHKGEPGRYAFGGVRTFPLIGLVGYVLSLLSGGQPIAIGIGLAVIGAFGLLSYRHKLQGNPDAGITTEISALATFLVGALVQSGHIWIGCALMIVSVLLLELKTFLEALARRIPPTEIIAFAKFLLLSVVLLPIIPNHDFTRFQLNPWRSWWVVVAVSAVSYGSYVAGRLLRGRGGVLLSALLGGAYSSTVTTVALSRRAARDARPHLYAGAILCASGIMYLRLIGLLLLFNLPLASRLSPWLLGLGGVALLGGWRWARRRDGDPAAEPGAAPDGQAAERNPLELRSALLFAGLFVGITVATRVVVEWLGARALYPLALALGVTDVDPFILSVAHAGGDSSAAIALPAAARAVLLATVSNHVAKAIYARTFADRASGREASALLFALALLGLLPLAFLR